MSLQQSRPSTMVRTEQGSAPEADPDDGITGSIIAIGFSVTMNVLTLVGVMAWGWPAGNVMLLFWIENVIIGMISLVRVVSARGTATDGSRLTVNGRPVRGTPGRYGLFFTLHYGIFCLVHGVFTLIVTIKLGVEPTFLWLGFPVIVVAVRYLVELLSTWFGPTGLRTVVSPQQAMLQPYPRIIVLHLAVLFAFWFTLGGGDGLPAAVLRVLDPIFALLPHRFRTDGVEVILILVVIKTVVDIYTTRRATRSG
ncbi:DUF6498-containing protein [Microlunatus parietis]|uniref:Uncharacterized protein n=1 Tax=Microlunatus parietis TaxID=682979 RepID=A0A7Y9IF18_9ACTN|nr:DUF6498-containing protein [Microlunatus parietis]NYE75019.1 hypothetical protein [Microlunatus parietis]